MFTFDGCIDRKTFLRAAMLRLGLFIASVVGFPFLLMAILSASKCGGVGGACGALGLVVSMAFKPFAFVLLVFSFVGISMRRTRDAGMPGPAGLLIPLLLASSYGFLIYAGAPWALAFSSGALFRSFPGGALLALYCIAFLCVMPSRQNRGDIANPFGAAGLIAFGTGALIAINSVMGLAFAYASIQPWILRLSWVWRGVGPMIPFALVAFAAALAWIAWRYRAAPGETAPTPTASRAAAKLPPPPIGWLLIAALAAALIACVVSLSKQFSTDIPFALIVNLSSMVIPTLAIWFFLLLGLWLVAVRRGAAPIIVLMLALLPFLDWGYAHWTTISDNERETAEMAAVPTAKAPLLPATIVFESDHAGGIHGAWKVPGIERVISKGAYGSNLMQFERAGVRDNAAKQSTVAALPERYLLLRVGRSSGFAKKGQIYSPAGGPLELRYVDASHDDLLAVWYRAFNPRPSMLPVLTTSGWYRGSNSATTTEIDNRIAEFLAASLKTAT